MGVRRLLGLAQKSFSNSEMSALTLNEVTAVPARIKEAAKKDIRVTPIIISRLKLSFSQKEGDWPEGLS